MGVRRLPDARAAPPTGENAGHPRAGAGFGRLGAVLVVDPAADFLDRFQSVEGVHLRPCLERGLGGQVDLTDRTVAGGFGVLERLSDHRFQNLARDLLLPDFLEIP